MENSAEYFFIFYLDNLKDFSNNYEGVYFIFRDKKQGLINMSFIFIWNFH